MNFFNPPQPGQSPAPQQNRAQGLHTPTATLRRNRQRSAQAATPAPHPDAEFEPIRIVHPLLAYIALTDLPVAPGGHTPHPNLPMDIFRDNTDVLMELYRRNREGIL